MKQNLVHFSYTVPEIHVFERKKDDRSLVKNVRSTLGHLKRYLLHGGVQRTDDFVENIYGNAYDLPNLEWYKKRLEKQAARRDKGEILITDGLFPIVVSAQIRSDIFKQLRCTSVLEVGSGRGQNIIADAALNLELQLTGLEPSRNGYERSSEWKNDIAKGNINLTGGEGDLKKIDFNKIHFVHGNGFAMPLSDKIVDASYTNLVLEQVSDRYPKILKEMRRVTRKYCIFLESFTESLSLAEKIFLKQKDYFRFSYKNFEKYGLRPIYFSNAFPQKATMGTGLLITEVL